MASYNLSAAAHVRIGNMSEPFCSSYVYLDRAALPVKLPEDLLPAS